MCKIDFPGLSLCPSGREHHCVSHGPQGLMDLVAAPGRGELMLISRLVEIASSSTSAGAVTVSAILPPASIHWR